MNIMELSGEAWHNAIEHVIDLLDWNAGGVLTFRNDWRMAQNHAIEHNLKFDLNGNLDWTD